MASNNFCEVCEEAGKTNKMVPFQINIQETLLICENPECNFPLGTSRVAAFTISTISKNGTSSCKPKTEDVGNNLTLKNSKMADQGCEKVIHWQNVDALCWLNSALSLLVHNRTIKHLLSKIQACENSLLKHLFDEYSKAQFLSQCDLTNASKILEDVRCLVWKYLSPKMKCTLGVNDSPVFALPLLLRENALTAENSLQEFTWLFSCQACGYNEKTRHRKHIVTIPNTPKNFNIQECSFKKSCKKCNSQDQNNTLIYESLPDMVLLHFVEGLNSADYLAYQLMHKNNVYCLTQFIQYVTNPAHFICWTKQDDGSKWLELDDLKPQLCSWTDAPEVSPTEVHIIVLQKVTSCNDDNNNDAPQSHGLDSHSHCKDTPQDAGYNHENVSMDEGLVSNSSLDSNCKETPKNTKCTADKEHVQNKQIEVPDISSEFHNKLKVSSDDKETPMDCVTEKLAAKMSSPATVDDTRSASTPNVIPYRKNARPQTPAHLTSANLSSASLFRVALKRLSTEPKFHPLLSKKRRTLTPQFQPYVPKKERQKVENTPKTTVSKNKYVVSENLLSPTGSDSGYSSPSSVSSCESSTNMDLRSKDETLDVADQLEKLLPDCLETSAPVQSCSAEEDFKDFMKITDDQEAFINELLSS